MASTSSERLATLERLVGSGKWSEALDFLEAARQSYQLNATERLLWSLAHTQAEAGKSTSDTHRVAIDAMSEILGVSQESPLALVVAKRALRNVPLAWRQRPAPKPFLSFLIIIAGAGLGGAIGYMVYLFMQAG